MKRFVIIIVPILVVFLGVLRVTKKYPFSPARSLDFSGEKIVTIDDNGLDYKLTTATATVGELTGLINPPLSDKDEIIPAQGTPVVPGMLIKINRQARVEITVDGQNREKFTLAKTVADVLSENEIALAPVDELEPDPQTRVSDGLKIEITRKSTEEKIVTEPIEFKEVEQKDSKVDWGEKVVSQKGEEGIRETAYKIDYENSREVKRVKLSSKITQKPVNQITKIGTRLKLGKAASGIASWYNAGLNECASRDHAPGTWLRVTNSTNGRQIYVQVAGYGPQAGTGKLIDLDNKSFKQLAPLGQGTMKVKVEEILNKGFKPDEE